MRIVDTITPYHYHQAFNTKSHRHFPLSYLLDFQQPFYVSSTFNFSIPLRPSTTLPCHFDLRQLFYITSTFNPPLCLRPSTILPCRFRPPILPHLFDLSHTHTISGTLAGCHTVQKDEDFSLGGLRVFTPNRAWHHGSGVPFHRVWCWRTDALRSGPTNSLCLMDPSLHVVGVGGQTLFCSGPTDVSW